MPNTHKQDTNGLPDYAQEAGDLAQNVLDYIGRSPTPFHAVENACALLKTAAYTEHNLEDAPRQSGQYYIRRNGSSLIAVSLNAPVEQGFSLIGAHTDSPCLKLKPEAAYNKLAYLQLGVEVYGGALLSPWFDRDLSIAGRLTATDKSGKLFNRLIDFKRPLGSIPSLAIHLNREVN